MAVLFCLILSSLIWTIPASAASSCLGGSAHYYVYVSSTYASCTQDGVRTERCVKCGDLLQTVTKAKGHSGTAYNGDCTKGVRCSTCGSTLGTQSSHTYANGSATKCSYPGCSYTRTPQSSSDANIKDMNNYAFKVYKVIRSICVPLAIISLASCGFTFLGSIFFGNYSSMAGGDMMKAKKQAVYTVLAIMFIVLLPKIFGAAISFFSATGWNP